MPSDLSMELAWMGLENIPAKLNNPFHHLSKDDLENPHIHLLKLFRKPEYFSFTCKHLFGVELLPFQGAILHELWHRPFPMLVGSRGAGKSWLLALYSMLRALLCQGSKVCVVGAAFRQSKVVFEYCEQLWAKGHVYRDIIGATRGRGNRDNGPRRDIDRCELVVGESVITALPLGDGKKIRGQRATHLIAEEFASISVDIYENVVAGFASVSADPAENVRRHARIEKMKASGVWSEELEKAESGHLHGNQAILSGTAYYAFNHFARYWHRYKTIIESQGDRKKLAEVFGGEENIDPSFNWRDYSIIRLPVTILPRGFMDERHVARSRATVHKSIFMMEFGSCFVTDSDGFFRRSLIESCVVGKPSSPVVLTSGEVMFEAALRGSSRRQYVFGVDPAAVQDNFSVVVLEVWPDHRRVAHCWTTTKEGHKARLKAGLVREQDFYGYCARKIRDLMKVFPCERIALDAQGGGIAVEEALHDPDKMEDGESPIWPTIDPSFEKRKPTDDNPGLHILEMVQFANSLYTSQANHGLRKDFEDKAILFPRFDHAGVGLALEEDSLTGRTYDTYEDCVMEIEELKDELASIVMSQTPNGREHWDTPEVKQEGGKKGRQRKDRYTALVMANMVARCLARAPIEQEYEARGGFAHALASLPAAQRGGAMYVGPDWFVRKRGEMSAGTVVGR